MPSAMLYLVSQDENDGGERHLPVGFQGAADKCPKALACAHRCCRHPRRTRQYLSCRLICPRHRHNHKLLRRKLSAALSVQQIVLLCESAVSVRHTQNSGVTANLHLLAAGVELVFSQEKPCAVLLISQVRQKGKALLAQCPLCLFGKECNDKITQRRQIALSFRKIRWLTSRIKP